MSCIPTADDRRLRKHFAAFAHNLRHAAGLPRFSQFHVSVLSDRCVVVHPAEGRRALLLEPRFIAGPSGTECFIHCRMASGTEGQPGEPLPLTAVWRCSAAGMVSRHPDDGEQVLGYLCDSVVAMRVLRTLATLEPSTVNTGDNVRREIDGWSR